MKKRFTAFAVLFSLVFTFSTRSEEATKPAPDPGDESVRTARAFLRAVCKGDDKAAYELTAPSYREKHAAEDFAKQSATLREAEGVKDVPPVSGWVLLKPKSGEPRRAMLAAGPSLEMRFTAARRAAAAASSPTSIGVELVESKPGGPWLVTDAKTLESGRKDQVGRMVPVPGAELREFSSPIRTLARKDSDVAREVSSAVLGEITEVKDGVVTVTPKNAKGEPVGGERKFKTDANTAVVVGVQSQPRPGADRRVPSSVTTRFRRAKISEFQPGKGTATIEPGGDADDYAMSVNVVMRPGDEGPGL